MAGKRRTLTWGDVQDWAKDNKITRDTPVHIADQIGVQPCLDLGEIRDDHNQPIFVLQAWWG